MANNSRIARRLVLYDPISDIELNVDRGENKLHISSAEKQTNYSWQSNGAEGLFGSFLILFFFGRRIPLLVDVLNAGCVTDFLQLKLCKIEK